MTYDPEARRDTPLALTLKERIRREGPITVAQYMQACLQDPEHGYYVKQGAIGRAGDFITAPEISQVFGELIGLWCAVFWQEMGAPEKLNLVELGPGRGTLMKDALRATRIVKGFHEAVEVHLVESNEVLRTKQEETLSGSHTRICWHRLLSSLPGGPAIIVANEFLDTLPVSQFEMQETAQQERAVGLDSRGHLTFTSLPAAGPRESRTYEACPWLAPGSLDERQDFSFLLDLRRRLGLAEVAMLFIDYGHVAPSAGDTLQAVRNHKAEHPLTSPGEADLTVQVDFTEVTQYATSEPEPEAPPLAVDGPITQAEFLGALGIMERASRLMAANPAKAHEIEMGVARLMAPNGMGTRFKALGLRSAGLPKLPGFLRKSVLPLPRRARLPR